MGVTQYIGSRYVPVFADPAEWNNTRTYEPLTIVMHEGNSYTSVQYVPKGVDVSNEDYWAETGNYNAQIEAYRREVIELNGKVADIHMPNLNALLTSDNLSAGDVVYVAGYKTPGDKGQAMYYMASSGAANGYTVHKIGDLYATMIIGDSVNVAALGINENTQDCGAALQEAFEYADTSKYVFNGVSYKFLTQLRIPANTQLYGTFSAMVPLYNDDASVLDFSKYSGNCAIIISGTVNDSGEYINYPVTYKGTDIDKGVVKFIQNVEFSGFHVKGTCEQALYMCCVLSSKFSNLMFTGFEYGAAFSSVWYSNFSQLSFRVDKTGFLGCNDLDQNVFENINITMSNKTSETFSNKFKTEYKASCMYLMYDYGSSFSMVDLYTENKNAAHLALKESYATNFTNLFAEGEFDCNVHCNSVIGINIGAIWSFNSTDNRAYVLAADGYDEITIGAVRLNSNTVHFRGESSFVNTSRIVFTNIDPSKGIIENGVSSPGVFNANNTLYVDAENGSDYNSGDYNNNLKTLDEAITRTARYGIPKCNIKLKNGIYRLTEDVRTSVIIESSANTEIYVGDPKLYCDSITFFNGKITFSDVCVIDSNLSIKIRNCTVAITNDTTKALSMLNSGLCSLSIDQSTVTGTNNQHFIGATYSGTVIKQERGVTLDNASLVGNEITVISE